ncbi:hypothetical protein DFJ43DRAFT_1085035 [Lentinula guzmanii]|uniref:Uncharacterized protein n=1 Tax=Lentinula guzmanii TaxID=2804957 RepID=A0AA38MXZ1_9AGAR|nr:hypothetical protein DFJ43DRAFT_1085035 [Lentinula guzmanii]
MIVVGISLFYGEIVSEIFGRCNIERRFHPFQECLSQRASLLIEQSRMRTEKKEPELAEVLVFVRDHHGLFLPRSACLCLYGFILAPSYSGHLDRRFYWSECCSAVRFVLSVGFCVRWLFVLAYATLRVFSSSRPHRNEKSADMEIVTGLWRLVSTRPVKFHILYWGSN